MAVVGIDLGTTYSVVATPKYFEGEYFTHFDEITIIKDQYKQRITPSVVAIDGHGKLVVGRRAKARVGQKPNPIMFVKRFMGEDKEFILGTYRLKPEEVSAEILRYLKAMAEEQMKEPIDEAVITVPAYFNTLQKQKTKEAGELAGLKVGRILQEPVAASLAYFQKDKRDPLTIMTYDLGGGTFDVAIVSKEKGIFNIKAHDGDRYLGGYDFDKRLAFWIIDQLNNQGFELKIDPQQPEQSATWNKFLFWAETAIIKLSDYECYMLSDANTGIKDAKGELVMLDIEITQQIVEQLINDYIEKTIRLCRQALEKAKLKAEALNEIIMVGGSSRIPMIAQRLETEFKCRPHLSEPDLSVAIGAAIVAKQLGQYIGMLKLDAIPETTSLPTVQITGVLKTTEQIPDVTGYCVVIESGEDSRKQKVDAGGAFVFQDINLKKDSVNEFTLHVKDSRGEEVLTYNFSVKQEKETTSTGSLAGFQSNVLAKPIAIMTVSGLHTVAKERTPLPYLCHVPAETKDQSGFVSIPIYEDTYQIGEILVDSVPKDLPVGTRIDITLNLLDDFYIEGKASIPKASIEVETKIQIPPVQVKDIATLQEDYVKTKIKSVEALAQADRGEAFSIAPHLKETLKEIHQLLYKEREPNLAKAQELLDSTKTMIQQLSGWKPEPPVEQFEQLKIQISRNLSELVTLKPELKNGTYDKQYEAIIEQADEALSRKDQASWSYANRQLKDLRQRIVSIIEQEKAPPTEMQQNKKPPDARSIKLSLGMELTRLRKEADRKARLQELEQDFSTCESVLKGIDVKTHDVMNQLLDYYENYHQPLIAKVTQWGGKSIIAEGLVQILKGV